MVVLRKYQEECLSEIWNWLCSREGNPLAVLPTGAGKSILVAELCRRAVTEFGGKVMVLTHVRELIEQNYYETMELLGQSEFGTTPLGGEGVSLGIYSAGMNRRETESDVVFAGIQSVWNKWDRFANRDLVLIDECHLVPPDGEGRYRSFIENWKTVRPRGRIVGLTATPFRLQSGLLWGPDRIFKDVAYDVGLKRLIDEKYLSTIVNKIGESSPSTDGLHLSRGEFMESEMDRLYTDSVNRAIAKEMIDLTADRKSVLVFCVSIKHADHMSQILNSLDLNNRADAITSESLPLERDAVIRKFKNGELKYLCNVNVLTTGFNATNVDAIAVIRATNSVGLFIQMVGRGLRLHPGKTDCLLLDFGENLKRHGPINSPGIRPGSRSQSNGHRDSVPGDKQTKQCPNCGEYISASGRQCDCGFVFSKIEARADDESKILSADDNPIQECVVVSVDYKYHRKKGATDTPCSVCVSYTVVPLGSGLVNSSVIKEWVCFDHTGYARERADSWWAMRNDGPSPVSVQEFFDFLDHGGRSELRVPSRLMAKKDGKWDKIVEVIFPRDQTSADENGSLDAIMGDADQIPF